MWRNILPKFLGDNVLTTKQHCLRVCSQGDSAVGKRGLPDQLEHLDLVIISVKCYRLPCHWGGAHTGFHRHKLSMSLRMSGPEQDRRD